MKKRLSTLICISLIVLLSSLVFLQVHAQRINPSFEQLITSAENAKETERYEIVTTKMKAHNIAVPESRARISNNDNSVESYFVMKDGSQDIIQDVSGNISISENIVHISSDSLDLALTVDTISESTRLKDNLVIMDSQSGTHQVFRLTDFGLVMYTIINETNSVFSKEIGLDISSNGRFEMAAAADGTYDGSILLYSSEGDINGAIGATKVYDANGIPVGCTQTIKQSAIRFDIDADSYSYTYPLVAITSFSPYTDFFTYFDGWITRYNYGGYTGCTSLGLFPKNWGALTTAEQDIRWAAVVNYIPNPAWINWTFWANESGMKKQFICHDEWKPFSGSEWNLEPSRTGNPSIFNACNPGSCP